MRNLIQLLFAAGIFLAQASTPEEEAVRFVNEGQYGKALPIVTQLLEQTPASAKAVSSRARLLQLLGTVEHGLGRYAEAEKALSEGVDLCRRQAAPDPSVYVTLLVALGEAYIPQGRFKEAEQALRRGQVIAQRDLPDAHPGLASALGALGTLYWTQGLLSRAETAFRSSMAILEKQFGSAHPDFHIQVANLAALLVMTGRRAEGVSMLERAEKGLEARYGQRHPRTIGVSYSIAVAITQSAPARAETILRRVISNWLSSQPELHANTAVFLNALAQTRYEQHDTSEAIRLNERALAIAREALGEEHSQVMALLYYRARILKAAKRGKEAAAVKAQADRIQAKKQYAEIGRYSIDVHTLREK